MTEKIGLEKFAGSGDGNKSQVKINILITP